MQQYEFKNIPKGSFVREDGRVINVNAFSIASHELTKELWDMLCIKSSSLGYDLPKGRGVSKFRPISCITWYDAIKACNALSELSGLTPAYYKDTEQKVVYRAGEADIATYNVDWTATGYRLPTEAEWEYACRAGTTTKYYWGEHTTAGPDNCYAKHYTSVYNMCVPSDVGTLKPNNFGLYDMSGNVFEWCWDIYGEYNNETENPKGADKGVWRVIRGGSVTLDSPIHSSYRAYTRPDYKMYDTGLRLASSNKSLHTIPISITENNVSIGNYDCKASVLESPINKLKGLLDINHKDLTAFKEELEQGDDEAAEDALCITVIQHFKELDLSHEFAFQTREKYEHLKTHKGKVVWFGPDAQISLYMESPKWYVKWFKESGSLDYIKKWFEVAEDFSVNNKAEFDRLSDEHMLLTKEVPVSWTWGAGYCVQRRARALLSTLAEILKLCGDNNEVIAASTVCRLLISLATDHLSDVIKDDRKCVPNQYINNAATLLLFGAAMPWFKDAGLWTELGKNRLLDAIFNSTMLPDGGDMEQSFNYNAGMPNEIYDVSQLLGKFTPKWFSKLYDAGLLRIRMLRALTQPIGGVPGIGSAATSYPPMLGKQNKEAVDYRSFIYQKEKASLKKYACRWWEKAIEQLWGNGTSDMPQFGSIAFPYSGYYIMRNGWKNNSLYMWFDAARKGRGHVCDNINSVSICGYGRHLICEPGALTYGNKGFVPEDQHHLMQGIDSYQNSSLSRNTVSVDGYSQKRYSDGENTGILPYKDTIKNKWHTSDNIDYVEGAYLDGYGDAKINIEAAHYRKIIFLKKLGIWVIVDSMQAEKTHEYKQVWAFPAEYFQWDDFEGHKWNHNGFADSEIIIDEEAKKIYTADPEGGNVYLYTIGDNLEYKRFIGSTQPYAGWMSPRILSRRVPKTDIHINHKAQNSTIITIIAPTPDNTEPVADIKKISNGFEAVVGEKRIYFECSDNAKAMNAGGLCGNCGLLMWVEQEGTDSKYGLTLDCKELSYENQKLDYQGDFELIINKEGFNYYPIEIPNTFYWKEDGESIKPCYGYHREAK